MSGDLSSTGNSSSNFWSSIFAVAAVGRMFPGLEVSHLVVVRTIVWRQAGLLISVINRLLFPLLGSTQRVQHALTAHASLLGSMQPAR